MSTVRWRSTPTPIANRRHVLEPWAALLIVTALAAWPLWGLSWPPGLDWPQHVALLDIIDRLLHGDPLLAEQYRITIQPVGYHLLYGLATPIAFVSDAHSAMRVVMTCVLGGHVFVIAWALHQRKLPLMMALVGIPAFYSAHFVWGFVVTLTATPFVFAALAGLLGVYDQSSRPRRAWLFAGATSFVAGLGHVVFVPLLLCASVCCAALCFRLRNRLSIAIATATGAALAAAPGACSRLTAMASAGAQGESGAKYSTCIGGLRKVWNLACSFDHRFAMVGWLVLWCTLLPLACSAFASLSGHPRQRRDAWCALAMFVTPFVLLRVVPLESWGPVGGSYLLNLRSLCVLPMVAAVFAARSPWLAHSNVRAATTFSLCLVCLLTVGAVMRLGRAYNAEVQDFIDKSAVLPPHARLAMEAEPVHVQREWPPLRQSMGLTIFPGRLSVATRLFINDHIPVHERKPGFMAQLYAESGELRALLDEEEADCQRIHALWTRFDGMFVQSETWDPQATLSPERASQLASGRHWTLLGPPRSPCRESPKARP